jgi:predicted RNA-binding protein with PUA-like domain
LSGSYPDPAKKDPKLLVFDIKAIESLPRAVPLVDLKAYAGLVGFDLIRLPRLSVMEVSKKQWRIIMRRAGK